MFKKIFLLCLPYVLLVLLVSAGCSKKTPTDSTTTGPGTITGVVTKCGDTTVIYGVAISTNPPTSSVSTNADGRYTISNVSAGNYTVTACISGYISKAMSLTVTDDNATAANFALISDSTIIEWVSIPAGNFPMGSTASDTMNWPGFGMTDEWPQHTVYLDAYQISKYEITNAQYKTFMDSGGYSNYIYWTVDGWIWKTTNGITEPARWASGINNSGPNFPNYPVVGVSWYEAYAFCQWAGGHLPTEAQWEKAARGIDSTVYWSWGSTWDASNCNCELNVAPDSFSESSPVGFFLSGVSPYGIYDMSGNVFEFVNDWFEYNYYSVSPSSNPTGPTTGTYRVMRGGSYLNYEYSCRCAGRYYYSPFNRLDNIGFRISK